MIKVEPNISELLQTEDLLSTFFFFVALTIKSSLRIKCVVALRYNAATYRISLSAALTGSKLFVFWISILDSVLIRLFVIYNAYSYCHTYSGNEMFKPKFICSYPSISIDFGICGNTDPFITISVCSNQIIGNFKFSVDLLV